MALGISAGLARTAPPRARPSRTERCCTRAARLVLDATGTEMTKDLTRRTTPQRRWKSWCGELQDLRRLISLTEQLASQRKSEILSSSLNDRQLGYWDDVKYLVTVTIVDGADSVTGPPETVLEELDRRTVSKVLIDTDFPTLWDEKLAVSLSKTKEFIFSDRGVKLEIRSSSPAWAKQCLAQMSDEIEKSVPRWSFFLTIKGRAALLALTYAVILGIALLIEARHVHRAFEGWALLTALFALAPIPWIGMFGSSIVNWCFPSFELYGEGGSPSGGRRLGAVLVFVASIAAGIIVNLIT